MDTTNLNGLSKDNYREAMAERVSREKDVHVHTYNRIQLAFEDLKPEMGFDIADRMIDVLGAIQDAIMDQEKDTALYLIHTALQPLYDVVDENEMEEDLIARRLPLFKRSKEALDAKADFYFDDE